MTTVLLVVIYIAFIGLGIPDSLFGTAWPAIYTSFGLPVGAASAVTLLISASTVISSLLSTRAIRRFGTGWVTAVSTAMTAAALLGFSFSANLLWLCLFSVPLGLGAGAVDSALNNYVALHYRASHMSFLHCVYGIGVSLSPYLLSLALSGSDGWRGGYRSVFWLQLAITAITLLALPLWKRAGRSVPSPDAEVSRSIGLMQAVRIPGVRVAWLVFIGSCALEYTCGVWGSTFLTGAKGMPVDAAARAITFYYIGMAAGRFLSGVLSGKLSARQLLHLGQGITLAAVFLLAFAQPAALAGFALFMIGLGNGPVFPNMIHLTPTHFGADASQAVMGTQMAASYLGIMLMPPLFGLIAQAGGIRFFPLYLLAMFTLMMAGTLLLYRRRCKNR